MLEGKEFEKEVGPAKVSVDVDKELNVKLEVQVPLLKVIEEHCAKNNISWDETLISGLKALLKLA